MLIYQEKQIVKCPSPHKSPRALIVELFVCLYVHVTHEWYGPQNETIWTNEHAHKHLSRETNCKMSFSTYTHLIHSTHNMLHNSHNENRMGNRTSMWILIEKNKKMSISTWITKCIVKKSIHISKKSKNIKLV